MIAQLWGVSFRYREEDPFVLQDVSLNLRRGEWTVLAGRSGSGKSSLALLLKGLHRPSRGEVRFPKPATTVALVFQNPHNQVVAPVVEEDVAFGARYQGLDGPAVRERVEEALRETGLVHLRHRITSTLSGGELQRLAIAGALAMAPDLLVLDEPTAMLDPVSRSEVLDLLQRLKGRMSLLMITHDAGEALFGDRLLLLADGRIVADGPPLEVMRGPADPLQRAGLRLPPPVAIGARIPPPVPPGPELADAEAWARCRWP